MGIKKKTVAQIEAELDKLDEERQRLRERARQLMKERDRKIREEQMDLWGLTDRQYQEAKAAARAAGQPAHVHLNKARALANKQAREARTAEVEAAQVGVQGRGV